MATINREGRKKREMRNLVRRGRVWYWKKMVDGRTKPVSLGTEDLELAKAKRNALEQKAVAGEWDKINGVRNTAGTLAEVFDRYDALGGLPTRTMGAYKSSMMTLVRTGLDNAELEPEEVQLSQLSARLVRDYQDRVRREYERQEGLDEKGRRMARDRADRTTKSTFNQAKSLFCSKRQLVERYREAGIEVPDSVEEFIKAGAVGKMSSKVYFPPSDAILAATFKDVEKLREVDEPAYFCFWAALATGCRRNELADMRAADLVERDGRLWVGAGLGKDGNLIQIPVITWPVHPANPRIPEQAVRELLQQCRETGREFLFAGSVTERYDEMPDRLNRWLEKVGWRDEKKLHGLRAFIGCKLFAKNPRLAQLYLRHKSIATTEKFYSHFLALNGAFTFEEPLPAAVPVAVVQTSGQAA